jgi:hypothetical protein
MLKTAGHVKKHYKPVCSIFEEFKDGATLEGYVREVEKYAANIQDEDTRMSFKGDMLEILAEIFFKAFENNPAVGLRDYTPIPLDEDFGVDGKGINANGKDCAVQVKYRGNPFDLISYSDIARTYTSANLQLGLELEGDDRIYVFTTAIDVNIQCHTVFKGMVRVLGKEIVSREINNNRNFWLLAYNEVRETLLNQ